MKKSISYIYILLSVVIFSSCEKIINVDLNKGNPKLVVDAWITDSQTDSINLITLTQTASYFDDNVAPKVKGANVILRKDDGTSETLSEIMDGIYATHSLVREPFHNYYLYIKTNDGKEYNASAYMPRKPILDSITSGFVNASGFFQPGYHVLQWGKDNQQEANWYKWDFYQNDTLVNFMANQWFIREDRFIQGNVNGTDWGLAYKKNSLVTLRLHGLNKETYDYLTLLQTQLSNDGGLFSPPPANPKSNISNGGIGFFIASAVTKKSVFIK